MLNEFYDFWAYERRFGLKVLFKDVVSLNKLNFNRYYLNKIIADLRHNSIKATFFLSAKGLNYKILNLLLEDGHEVASHGYNHLLLSKLDNSRLHNEFCLAERSFSEYGIKPRSFRPPFLDHDEKVLCLASDFGFKKISTTYDIDMAKIKRPANYPIIFPCDWRGKAVKGLSSSELLSHWKNKLGVILLHPSLSYDIVPYLDFCGNCKLGQKKALTFDVYL